MVLQFAFALLLSALLLQQLIIAPIAFTVVTAGLAFLLAYWSEGARLGDTEPPSTVESLPEMIRGLETSMGVTVRNTYVTENESPRAEIRPLVLHRSVDLYLTAELFNSLELDEVTAVIAHELAHVKYHDHHYRTFSAVTELFSMTTATMIVSWTLYTVIPELLRVGVSPVPTEPLLQVGVAVVASVVLWVSGRSIPAAYRRTAEFVADKRAGDFASHESMYTALNTLSINQIVGPSPSFIEQPTNDYPLIEHRLTQLRFCHNKEHGESND